MLLHHHKEACAIERKNCNGLQTCYEMLFHYQEKAYEDKMQGKISEELWKKNEAWQGERAQIKDQLECAEDDFDERIRNGVALIELLEGTENTWKNAPKGTKERIINLLVSNLKLRNGIIEYSYKKTL